MAVIFKFLEEEKSYPQSLSDITFQQFIDYLEKILPRKPVVLQNLEQAFVDENILKDELIKVQASREKGKAKRLEELNEEIKAASENRVKSLAEMSNLVFARDVLPYMAEVVSFFCQIPYDMIMGISHPEGKGMDPTNLESLYWLICSAMEIRAEDYKYQKEYEFNDRLYLLPDRYMEKSTVIEFMESAQLQAAMEKVQNGYFHSMLDVCSVLLKRKKERYSDAVYERNKKEFRVLPMSVVVQVAFFLLKRNEPSKRSSKTSMTRQV